MDEENNNALSEEELDEIIKQNPQMGITEAKRKELTEQVTRPILEESEKRMTEAVRGEKPAEPITRQEQIEATPEGVIPSRPSGVPSPKADRIALPTTLPKHGVRALYSEGERILERAAQVTNLPPESPATQAIAQRMAKGDPFSTEALEDARQETMKLVRSGLIPNPNYEGWAGKVIQAYEFGMPMVVEIGLPMTQAIATSPLLVSPVPGSRVAYFAALGQTGVISNLWAQQMRIGYGHQDETSWQEAFAAGGWSMVPGFGEVRKLGKAGKAIIGGFEAALMAGGENLTKQGLEIIYGKRDEISGTELALTTGGGAIIGTILNRIGSALDIKYDPKEKAYPLIRQALKENIRAVKKEVARLRKAGQTKDLDKYQAQISSLEDKLNNLAEPENKVLQRAIDQLEEQEQKQVEAFELFAKEWQESKAAQALKESDVQAGEQELGVWTGLSETEELFKTPVIDSTDFATLSEAIAPKAGRVVPKTIPGARPESARSFDIIDTESVDPEITPPLKANQGEYGLEKGTPFYRTTVASHDQEFLRTTLNQVKDLITLDLGNKELVEVGALKTGRTGQGGKIYQVALQYAHNTDKVYIPKNLSFINVARTLGSMFSSALKNKTTKHFAPIGGEQADQMAAMGLPKGYKWGQDFQKDLDYLAIGERNLVKDRLSKTFKYGSQQVEKEGIKTRIPEEAREATLNLDDYKYSFEDDVFTGPRADGSVGELSTEDINNLIKSVDPDFTLGIGASTFKRAVVTDSIEKMPFIVGDEAAGKIAQRIGELEGVRGIFPAPTTAGDLDVRFTGPKKAGIAQEFKEKTLIEGVGQRMQTDNPVTAREALQELVDKTGGRLGQYQPVIDRLLALGKGTGIDAKLETRAAASDLPTTKKGSFYESGRRRIVFDGESSSFQQNPIYELLHESTHAVTIDNVVKYFDANAFNKIDINDIGARAAAIDEVLKKRLPKPIAEMFRMFKKADSMRDEIIAKADLKTVAGEPDTYWIKNPAEFMSMAFSDPVVQRALKGIEYDPKMSMWDKVVDTVKRLLGKGVTNDLADSIVTRVGEIAEMRLPTQRGRSTVDFAREILDDFKGGGGTRDVDPGTGKPMDTEDEIKARLLTDDAEKQRLINSVQDAIKEDLKNIKGGREGQLEYLAKVQRELDRRLGVDAGEEFALVLKASQLSDNLEVADALNELSIQMTANGAVMVKGFDDLLKATREKNFDSPEELNDAMVSIHKLIPQMLGWKKTGSAAGRLLQSRKYTKDQLEVKIEQLETEMEENLVSSLKSSKDMTPEELDKQIKTFGDIEAVKRLLKAVQQADDVSEVKDILIKQQQAFQNKSTLKKNFDQGANLYTKVRDVGQDLLYSSMLSAPTTLIKVGLGNAVMSRYNSWMGKVGAKYMAVAPWARRGMSKEQFDEAYNFWSRVASSYGEFNDIALQEAKKAFKSGISDLRSHFERVGESALSMERTGLSGALGQSLENLGQFVDVPGKAMAAVDARSRMRIAHAMTKSKAAYDWRMAKLNGEEVPDNFDNYYKGFLNKVFTEDGTRLMTEDQVRRQAVLNAEKEGVPAENMASYIDNYVKNNWDTSTSNFVDYVQRNIKEVTFTDELGEFAAMNTLEVPVKGLENMLNTFPLLKTILNPFQRTGRNIIREGLSTTSALADVPGLKKFSDKIWSKTVQDLNSNDPIIAARAKGRQIVGAGIIATAWGMAEAGLYEGMISQNWKKRENIQTATGLNDYELRIPVGDGKYIGQDIAALEPFATVMNIVADCHTLSKGSMAQKREAMSALNILALVVSNNIGNKSYFKNLGDALQLITVTSESEEAVEAKRMRLLKGMLGAGVPSAMNAMSMATDEFRRRSDDILKMLAKRIGGIAREVPVHRDMWGEPQQLHKTDKAQAVSLINPFKLGKQLMDVDDYVIQDKDGLRRFDLKKFKSIDLKNKEEVRNAAWAVALELDGEYHFNGGTSIKDGIDLQEIIHPETRIDAFERWQEIYKNQKIDGLTVQQATVVLARQLTTPTKLDPNQIPEGFKQEDKRLALFRKVLNGYKKVAYEKMRREYPVLLEQEKEDKIRNALLTTSPNAEQLKRITSEMPVEEYKKTQPDTRLQERLKKTPYGPAVKLLEVID